MTISARELRIGNTVYSFGQVVTVLEVLKNRVHVKRDGLDNYYPGYESLTPIPITEEWLLKWGFKLDEYRFVFNQWRVTSGRPLYKWILGCDACPYMGKLEYVHQLQNLYFALTGEELELTSNKEQP